MPAKCRYGRARRKVASASQRAEFPPPGRSWPTVAFRTRPHGRVLFGKGESGAGRLLDHLGDLEVAVLQVGAEFLRVHTGRFGPIFPKAQHFVFLHRGLLGGELGRINEPIEVVNYEVVAEIDETPFVVSAILPPDAGSFVIPAEIIALGDEIKFEVLVREASFNQTGVESCFVLAE